VDESSEESFDEDDTLYLKFPSPVANEFLLLSSFFSGFSGTGFSVLGLLLLDKLIEDYLLLL